jgi:ABC-type phosphate transport system substrate-binding protein
VGAFSHDFLKLPAAAITVVHRTDSSGTTFNWAFILMRKTSTDPTRSKAALSFFHWALESGQDIAASLDDVPLPPGLVMQIERYWKSQPYAN